MKRIVPLLALILGLASMRASAADQILTFAGLGPVHIGMTVDQAEKALGAKFSPMRPDVEDEHCWMPTRADGIDPLVSYMIWDDQIVRIDIDETELGKEGKSVPPVATEKGIRIGSSEAEIKERYGSALDISQDPYGDVEDHYITAFDEDKQRGILFETREGRVGNFRSGTAAAIKLAEGCS